MGANPAPRTAHGRAIAVLGGGLAGISAARRLLERGYDVTLVERRPHLGGRVFSFRHGEGPWEMDNGQHVFLGCCTHFVDLLRWAGVRDRVQLQPKLRIEVVRDGRTGVISSAPLLGPFHLLPSLLRFPHLGFRDKASVVYGMLRARLADRRRHGAALEGETAHRWLKRHHQTDRAIENLWNLVILPALNDDVTQVSADMALMLVQEGLLGTPFDAAFGYPTVALGSLVGEPARRRLKDAGCRMLTGVAARAIVTDGVHVAGVALSDGQTLHADAYVSALPHDRLLAALPPQVAGDPFFSRAARLEWSPILGVHVWYDRPVMDGAFAAFLDSPAQWVFNKSAIMGQGAGPGQHLCVSVSGAWDHVSRPKTELADAFARELASLLPRARTATIQRLVVVKQPRATFRSTPGAAAWRLPQRTPIRNLFLAGDWTDTGWPATMEGAVRSGTLAAECVAAGA